MPPAEREAAKTMVDRTVTKRGATLGADKAYDVAEFVEALQARQVTPRVTQKAKGKAIDGRTTQPAGYRTSLKIRKRIEEIFGWSKTVGGLRKTRCQGLDKVTAQTVFTFAAYNLTRIGGLCGWRWSTD
jgi:IS5 family transposase